MQKNKSYIRLSHSRHRLRLQAISFPVAYLQDGPISLESQLWVYAEWSSKQLNHDPVYTRDSCGCRTERRLGGLRNDK